MILRFTASLHTGDAHQPRERRLRLRQPPFRISGFMNDAAE
jgi:hypothetical protein